MNRKKSFRPAILTTPGDAPPGTDPRRKSDWLIPLLLGNDNSSLWGEGDCWGQPKAGEQKDGKVTLKLNGNNPEKGGESLPQSTKRSNSHEKGAWGKVRRRGKILAQTGTKSEFKEGEGGEFQGKTSATIENQRRRILKSPSIRKKKNPEIFTCHRG